MIKKIIADANTHEARVALLEDNDLVEIDVYKRQVITSGKGGVGKTTSTANLGTGLAMQGKKVVLVDTDIGLRNLDVVLGLENRIVYDLVDVVEGTCKLKQALIKDCLLYTSRCV